MSSAQSISPSVADTDEFVSPFQPHRVTMSAAGLTHPGRVRPTNEDHFLIARLSKSMRIQASSLPQESTRLSDEEGHLLLVADGMGGAAGGEVASALAVRSVEDFVLNTVRWFLHLGQQEENDLLGELREAVERADRTVIDRAETDFHLAGMGTTLTMAYSVQTDLFVVHAGDTRAYLFRDGELEQVTNDHTLVQALVDGGAISRADARTHKRRHVVTNVIGGPERGVQAEIHKVDLRDGDVILLCSDGLTDVLDHEGITAALACNEPPEAAARRLLHLALDRGGPDNITAVVARYRVE
jgi:PPM family protein phosphatase